MKGAPLVTATTIQTLDDYRTLRKGLLLGLASLGLGVLFPAVVQAQTGTLFVEGDNVGIGTPTPESKLEVESSAGDAAILVEETNGTAASRTLYSLKNNGGIRFGMFNTSNGGTWQFSALANFNIDFNGNPGNELQVQADGDLVIGGSLTEGSSREIKKDFQSIDPASVLERLAGLHISTWTYKADESAARHLGPTAEDFYSTFSLGPDPEHISPSDKAGVALVALQALHKQVETRAERILELKSENQDLRTRLERLERAVADLTEQE